MSDNIAIPLDLDGDDQKGVQKMKSTICLLWKKILDNKQDGDDSDDQNDIDLKASSGDPNGDYSDNKYLKLNVATSSQDVLITAFQAAVTLLSAANTRFIHTNI